MQQQLNRQDTIVAPATPSGSGAIGVIRLSGPDALNIVNKVFKGKDLLRQASHTVHFGTLRDENTIIDEVLVSLFIAPHSYTRENVVEISTHGSQYITERVIKLLISNGARPAQPGEFTLRAFMNGAMDLSQAEAVADLIASNSAASHQIAMQQMRGGFSSELKKLRESLIHFASLIELELDFAEEDVEFANRGELRRLIDTIHSSLEKLINSFEQGNVLKNGVPVVIAGKPNVGKSTLLNALLKEDRAIVSDVAGTTRDSIEDEITIEGIVFRFIDTAGLRETNDVIEAIGVERTKIKMKQARLIIYLFDPDQNASEIRSQLQEAESLSVPVIGVLNKSDLLSNSFRDDIAQLSLLPISARDQNGLDLLTATILKKVHLHELSADQVIVTNIRHVEALTNTKQALERVLEQLDTPTASDFLAMDIRQALYFLGEITGSVSTDDLLENIFTKFCIGK